MSSFWLGTTTFYRKVKAPAITVDPPVAHAAVEVPVPVPAPEGGVSSSTGRREHKWKGSTKPDWIDSYSWVSVSLPVRKRMIELTNRDKEAKASAEAAILPAPEPGGAAPQSQKRKGC